MTIEEKAKAYDKAIAKAQKELQTCGSTDCDAARQIYRFFPELSESEDERIRKSIIAIINNYVDNSNTFKPKMLAWLEKQGEQPQGKTALEAAKEEKINILEVKEVDLKIAIDKWIDDTAITHEDCSVADVISTAKHFFELGLKVQKGE